MSGWGMVIPGRRQDQNTNYPSTSLVEWRTKMARRNGWTHRLYLLCRMTVLSQAMVTTLSTQWDCGRQRLQTASTWDSVSMLQIKKTCSNIIQWTWVLQLTQTIIDIDNFGSYSHFFFYWTCPFGIIEPLVVEL